VFGSVDELACERSEGAYWDETEVGDVALNLADCASTRASESSFRSLRNLLRCGADLEPELPSPTSGRCATGEFRILPCCDDCGPG
jgi:hypothetical protein